MAQRESRRSRDIMKRLRADGAFCFKVWGSELMMAGLPDIIGCYRGRFFGFEVKHPETREDTSVRQEFVMSKIRDAGGIAEVVCTKQEACDQLENIEAMIERGE